MENLQTSIEPQLIPPMKLSEVEDDSPVKHTVSVARTSTVSRDSRDNTIGEVRVRQPRIRCTDINVYYGA